MSSHVLSLFRRIFAVPMFFVDMADKCGIVPVVSSERFFDLRPGDAILAQLAFGMMSLLLAAAVIGTFVAFGAFKGLLVLLAAPPLVFLTTALLLRLTLEALLLFARK